MYRKSKAELLYNISLRLDPGDFWRSQIQDKKMRGRKSL